MENDIIKKIAKSKHKTTIEIEKELQAYINKVKNQNMFPDLFSNKSPTPQEFINYLILVIKK